MPASSESPNAFFIPDRKPRLAEDGKWIYPQKGRMLCVVRLDEHVVNFSKRFGVLTFSDGTKSPTFEIKESNPCWLAVQAMNFKRHERALAAAMAKKRRAEGAEA